ncbi:MAG: hypothetical protein IPN33_17695 [Saprospiraceae bacterium]|nr:hypothetical protein [Saprospiraceae bacterium]
MLESSGHAIAFQRVAAKPHRTFFCCNLNLGRAENGSEMRTLPIKNVLECAFYFKIRKKWLEVPFEGFGLGNNLSTAIASAKRGAKVSPGLVRAIGVFVGCEACKFSTRRSVHLVNIGAWHHTQCEEVEAENEARGFHYISKRGFGRFVLFY